MLDIGHFAPQQVLGRRGEHADACLQNANILQFRSPVFVIQKPSQNESPKILFFAAKETWFELVRFKGGGCASVVKYSDCRTFCMADFFKAIVEVIFSMAQDWWIRATASGTQAAAGPSGTSCSVLAATCGEAIQSCTKASLFLDSLGSLSWRSDLFEIHKILK